LWCIPIARENRFAQLRAVKRLIALSIERFRRVHETIISFTTNDTKHTKNFVEIYLSHNIATLASVTHSGDGEDAITRHSPRGIDPVADKPHLLPKFSLTLAAASKLWTLNYKGRAAGDSLSPGSSFNSR
jgi:hypothetical protein